jgi:hypothetical protein
MAAEEATFKCLRCGHEHKAPFDPAAPLIERQCPVCRSNSIRRLKKDAEKK